MSIDIRSSVLLRQFRGNRNTGILKRRKFHLKIGKNFFTVQVTKYWNRLPRESPLEQIFMRHLDTILSNIL